MATRNALSENGTGWELSHSRAYELESTVRAWRSSPLRNVRALAGIRLRLGEFLARIPLLFISVVIGIALLFRVGIGAMRSPAAEPEAPSPTVGAEAPHEAPPSPAVADERRRDLERTEGTSPTPATTPSAVEAGKRARHPRIHGRR